MRNRAPRTTISSQVHQLLVSSAFPGAAWWGVAGVGSMTIGVFRIAFIARSFDGRGSMARNRAMCVVGIVLAVLSACAEYGWSFDPSNALSRGQVSFHPIQRGEEELGTRTADATETLVYSNSLGRIAVGYGPGAAVADDLITLSSDGCLLSRYDFQVSGNSDGQGAGPFGVDFALYNGCPHDGGTIIIGTEGFAELPGAGDYQVVVEIPALLDIAIPATVWLRVVFNREHAGWIGGAPALVGYSDDAFDHPQVGCSVNFGGFPAGPQASFNARLFVRDACPATYLSYHSSGPRRGTYNPGKNVRMADDIALQVDGCEMSAYEFTVRGPAVFDVDLRLPDGGPDALPGFVIEGTQRSFAVNSSRITVGRTEFDPPIAIPRDLWFTISASTTLGRSAITSRPPRVGTSEVHYALFDGTSWSAEEFTGPFFNGSLDFSIYCAGTAPLGACCDMFFLDSEGEAVCRELPRANCPYPPPGSEMLPTWREGDVCGPGVFDPPCGTAACCRADGSCRNYTENECAPGGASWTRGKYCESSDVECDYVCVLSDQPCSLPHPGPGCINPFCCAAVCLQPSGAFCCQVEWDEACVGSAAQFCDLPPINDECVGPGVGEGARLVGVPSSTEGDSIHATQQDSDPGFCCQTETPGAKGYGTVWYRFIATATSARISTCQSNAPAVDSIIQVFSPSDPSSQQAACASLQSIGCNDDAAGCGANGTNSRMCIRGLVPGQPYYVMVAAQSEAARGLYRLRIEAPCTEEPPTPCGCPAGQVQWIDPPNGVVDAGRPFLNSGPLTPMGIDRLTLKAPTGADQLECWDLCETKSLDVPNSVIRVSSQGGGMFSITLGRAITPGAATTITYNGDPTTTGVFISHPANVNGDSATGPVDLLDLIDALNGVRVLPWGLRSGDIDRSGLVAPADILEEVDLLNGAGGYAAWNGTPRPDPATCR